MSIPGKIIKTIGEQTTKRVYNMMRDKKNQNVPEPSEDPNEDANTIIRNHVAWSMGMGLIPVLMADIFAVSALQLDMIKQLCKVYGVDYKETEGKAIVTSLTGSTLARLGAASVVKLIPGIGSVLGGITVSSFAGASTYALGEVFKKHFSEGGTILDFDPKRLKNYYNSKFEKGKDIAKQVSQDPNVAVTADPEIKDEEQLEIRKKSETDTPKKTEEMSADAMIARLKELDGLRKEGIITDEEFQSMKSKLLDKL
jgi:uncharacterized protein (DUF697 family)